MSSNEFFSMFGCIVFSIVLFYLVGNTIKRSELLTIEFPLRMFYPKGYIKQNRVLKFIRSRNKLKTNVDIHWMYYVFHYLQGSLLIVDLVFFLPYFRITIEQTVFIFGILEVAISCCLFIIMHTFCVIQAHRCNKIKKTNPEYSKCELRNIFGSFVR